MKKVAIPEKMQKFYGIGTMLHPDKEMVEAMIREIPIGKVATIDSLCGRLADDYGTDVTCPMRTTNLVKAVMGTSANSNTSIPFWRIIRKNHLLINSPFTVWCAENLEREGFQLDKSSYP
ncbi:MAG: hypothetical protein AAFX87_30905 [Bacteroidota bacterium]